MKSSNTREMSLVASIITRVFDICMIIAAARFSYSLVFDSWNVTEPYRVIYGLATFAVLAIFPAFNLYNSDRLSSLLRELVKVLYAVTTIFLLLALVAVMTKVTIQYSRRWFIFWFLTTVSFISIYRLAFRILVNKLRASKNHHRKVVIAGSSELAERVHNVISSNSWLGLQACGFYGFDKTDTYSKLPYIEDLLSYITREHVSEVWVSLPLSKAEELEGLLNELSIAAVTIRYIPDIFGLDLINHSVEEVDGLPIVNITNTPMRGWNAILKWLEDKVLSLIILTLISPIMVMVAIGVKLSSPGPVFYRQERVSWNGKSFHMLKFRSMPVNNEKDGAVWGGAKNKEVTPFGKFIRKTSLDELPQFLNVLLGDMSIIGPRPERTVFVDQFKHEIPRYMQKHMMKAGISGWAQIHGWRGDTDLKKRIEYDLYYIENWSLLLDIKIIFLTIFKGFVNKNAY